MITLKVQYQTYRDEKELAKFIKKHKHVDFLEFSQCAFFCKVVACKSPVRLKFEQCEFIAEYKKGYNDPYNIGPVYPAPHIGDNSTGTLDLPE